MEILAKLFLTGMALAFWGMFWSIGIDHESFDNKDNDDVKVFVVICFLLPLPIGLLTMLGSGLLIVWFK